MSAVRGSQLCPRALAGVPAAPGGETGVCAIARSMARGQATSALIPLRVPSAFPGVAPLAARDDRSVDVPGSELEFALTPTMTAAATLLRVADGRVFLASEGHLWAVADQTDAAVTSCPPCRHERMPDPCWHVRGAAYLAARGLFWPEGRLRYERSGGPAGAPLVERALLTGPLGLGARSLTVFQAVRVLPSVVLVVSAFDAWRRQGHLILRVSPVRAGACGACLSRGCYHAELAARIDAMDAGTRLLADLVAGRVERRERREETLLRAKGAPGLAWTITRSRSGDEHTIALESVQTLGRPCVLMYFQITHDGRARRCDCRTERCVHLQLIEALAR